MGQNGNVLVFDFLKSLATASLANMQNVLMKISSLKTFRLILYVVRELQLFFKLVDKSHACTRLIDTKAYLKMMTSSTI